MTDEVRKRKRGTEESKGDLNIFEWNIANFQDAFENTSDHEKVTSPVFVGKSVDLPNSFWHIEVHPKVRERELGKLKYLGLFLVFSKELNAHNPVVRVKTEFSLLDRNQKAVCTRAGLNVDEYGAERISWGFPVMATNASQLHNFSNLYLEDDVLRIRVKVWIQNENTNAAFKKPHTDQLHQNLSQLLDSSKFSDVDIVVEDVTLKAHKNILSCRSPVFAAMFQNDMAESLTNTVKIEDFSEKTVKGMLEFIYSGNLDCIEEDFLELLKIAEKYELEELKVACSKAAIFKISVENVIELVILGDMCNVPELKYRAMAFINTNKANPLFSPGNKNGAFEKFAKDHPLLVSEMYQQVRNNDVDVHHAGQFNETIEKVTRFITDLNG